MKSMRSVVMRGTVLWLPSREGRSDVVLRAKSDLVRIAHGFWPPRPESLTRVRRRCHRLNDATATRRPCSHALAKACGELRSPFCESTRPTLEPRRNLFETLS